MDPYGQQQQPQQYAGGGGPAAAQPEIEENNNDLLKMAEHAQLFLGKSTNMNPPQYAEFWLSPKIASLGTVLLSKILMAITGEEKTTSITELIKKITNNAVPPVPELTKLPELDAEGYTLFQSLILTAYFGALLYPFNANFAALRASLGRLVSFRQKTRVIAPQTPDFLFISEVERMYATRDYLNSGDILRFCIQQATQPEFPEDFEPSKTTARQVAPSFLYSYFRLRMMEPQRARETFEACLAVMEHPSITDDMVLTMMHMVRTFLHYCPIPPVDLYPKLIERATKFYLWPRPYSDAARDLLEVLSVEIKSPGAALRARIHEETASIYPIASSGVVTGKERFVHLLIDKDLPNARWLMEILRNYVPPRPSDTDLQLRIIMTVFIVSLPNTTPDQLGLEYLPKEHVNHFYNRVIQIMDQCAAMPNEADAVKYREEHLANVKQEILQSLGQTQQSYPPRPPRVPSVEFLFRVSGFTLTTQTKDSSYNTRYWYPKRESTEMLATLLRDYTQFASPAYRPVVKIGIVGNDATMHNIVCGYVCLRLQQPDLFDRLDVRFFFIPAIQSTDLGNYLGTADKWYGAHVVSFLKAVSMLVPTLPSPQQATPGTFGEITQQQPSEVERAVRSGRSVSISPALVSAATASPYSMHSQTSQDPMEPLERVLCPSAILRMELETYFREAKWPVNMHLYRAECSAADNSTITIPFFSRAQLGLYAHAEVFRKQQDLPATMSREEVVNHSKFNFKPVSFQIKYLQMNPVSQARAIGQQDYRQYQQICMASIPTAGDRAMNVNADPTHPWLELLLVDNSKKTGQRADPRVYHVSQVELLSERVEPFHLLLDGRVYGPFVKVKITGAMYPDKDKIYTMPIMTYSPVDLGD